MIRIDFLNPTTAYNYSGYGINGIQKAAGNDMTVAEHTPEAQVQAAGSRALDIIPVERGNQDPREAAQLIKPFNSSIPNFTDSDRVHTSDMSKAISDMQRDDMLREYQYFVGSANKTGAGISDVAYQDEDGLVRRIS